MARHGGSVVGDVVLPILLLTLLGISSIDGCSLMLPPCFGEQSSQYLDREALASQVRKMEEENQLLKLQLSHSQAQEETLGRMDFSQQGLQFIKEQEGRSNYSGCPKQRMVQKCEVTMRTHYQIHIVDCLFMNKEVCPN